EREILEQRPVRGYPMFAGFADTVAEDGIVVFARVDRLQCERHRDDDHDVGELADGRLSGECRTTEQRAVSDPLLNPAEEIAGAWNRVGGSRTGLCEFYQREHNEESCVRLPLDVRRAAVFGEAEVAAALRVEGVAVEEAEDPLCDVEPLSSRLDFVVE